MNNDDVTIIGEIDFSDIEVEESNILAKIVSERYNISIGGKLNKCYISVYGHEGTIPHFHLDSKDGSFSTCIEIFRAVYFHHTGHEGILSKSQCKALDKWLGTIDSSIDNKSFWELIAEDWEDRNNLLYNPKSTKPDYTNIELN